MYMNNVYRVYTVRTICILSSLNDALSLIHHIPNAKIEVFNNITPIGIYTFKNNILYYNGTPYILDGYMKEWFSSNTVDEKSELNLFIPFSSVNENENKKLSLEELQLKIKKLEAEAYENDNKLEEIKEKFNDKEENFNEKKEEFDKVKKNYEKEKEYWYQLKNKLEADKRVYFIIKEQLDSGELTEESIPILFQDKYPIFKYLDENKLIDSSDTICTEEINNYLINAPKYKIDIDLNNTFNELFSSSDPIYGKNKSESSCE